MVGAGRVVDPTVAVGTVTVGMVAAGAVAVGAVPVGKAGDGVTVDAVRQPSNRMMMRRGAKRRVRFIPPDCHSGVTQMQKGHAGGALVPVEAS